MPLKHRVTLILIAVCLLAAGASLAIQRHFILPRFVELERQSARANLDRVVAALARELAQLAPSAADWAFWTDTWRYARGENPGFVAENLAGGSALLDLKVNYLGIYRLDGTALWRAAVDLDSERPLVLGELTVDRLSSRHALLQVHHPQDRVQGIIRTMQGPMLVVSRPILTNEREGPVAGAFLLGRLVGPALAAQLRAQTHLDLQLTQINDDDRPAWQGDPRRGIAHTAPRLEADDGQWTASTRIADLYGKPALALAVPTPRQITALGSSAVNRSLWSLAFTALVMMAVLWVLLQRVVLGPLARLEGHARRIGAGQPTAPLGLARRDEIGLLARTFDDMVARLAEARRRLMEQSYHAGVAEMASGVLHNIGNAVTPLVVRLGALQERLGRAPVAEVQQASRELDDPHTDPQRHADLVQFLRLASEELARLVDDSRAEIAAAGEQVRHVQEILADQARFSRAERVIEPVDMAELIAEAVRDLPAPLRAALRVDVAPALRAAPPVAGARVALRQVVDNLLINAAEAVQAGPRGRGRLRIDAEVVTEDDGQARLHLCFRDDGAGIAPDHLARLFERGFSTKGRGSGQGLHWSANTVRSLGGRLRADSPGPGRGACLHLYLPLHMAAPVAATGTEG